MDPYVCSYVCSYVAVPQRCKSEKGFYTSPGLAADPMSALTLTSLASATADMADYMGDEASDKAAAAGSPGLTRSSTPGSLSP